MEYGVALDLWTKKELKQLQIVQNRALRRMLGGLKNTSVNAMNRLLRLELMEWRTIILHAKFHGKLRNSLDPTIPATLIWKALNEKRGTVAHRAKKNPLWSKLSTTDPRIDHMRDDGVPEAERIEALPKLLQQEETLAHIQKLDGRTASVIAVPNIRLPWIAKPRALRNRKLRSLILRWRIGSVCQHQQCQKCGDELSREHGLECSGAAGMLHARFPDVQPTTEAPLIIDALLNHLDNKISEQSRKRICNSVAIAIEAILSECRGISIAKTGRWLMSNEEEETNPEAEVTAPLTGDTSTNPRRTEQRRARAERLNLRRWTPRYQQLSLEARLEALGLCPVIHARGVVGLRKKNC
jgi:hypothetical protein